MTDQETIRTRSSAPTRVDQADHLRAELPDDSSAGPESEPALWARRTELRCLEIEQRQESIRRQLAEATTAEDLQPALQECQEQGWSELQTQCRARHRQLSDQEEAARRVQRAAEWRCAQAARASELSATKSTTRASGDQGGKAIAGLLGGAVVGALLSMFLAAGTCVCAAITDGHPGHVPGTIMILGSIFGAFVGLLAGLAKGGKG